VRSSLLRGGGGEKGGRRKNRKAIHPGPQACLLGRLGKGKKKSDFSKIATNRVIC